MTELEFKKMFEKHAENIVLEIISPIRKEFNSITDNILCNLESWGSKVKVYEASLKYIIRKQNKLNSELDYMRLQIEINSGENAHLGESIMNDVRREVELAKKSGEKAINASNKFGKTLESMTNRALERIDEHQSKHINMLNEFMSLSEQRARRKFELICVDYFQAVEAKIKALKEGL